MDPRLTRPGQARQGKVKTWKTRQEGKNKGLHSGFSKSSQKARQAGKVLEREEKKKKKGTTQRETAVTSPTTTHPPSSNPRLPSPVRRFPVPDHHGHLLGLVPSSFSSSLLLPSLPLPLSSILLLPLSSPDFLSTSPVVYSTPLLSLPLITYSSVVRIWFVQSFSPYVDENPRLLHQRETSLPRESNPPFFATLFYAIAVWNILYLRRLVFVVVLVALRAEQRAKSSL